MERLTSLLTLAFLLSISSAADGQGFRFTVAGDVRNANTWEGNYITPGQPVYLIDLLKTAGFQGEGNAFILRGGPPQNNSLQAVLSEFVSHQMNTQRSQLSSGDIVIFHQMYGKANIEGHILVTAGKQREVVPLDKIGSQLSHLLTALGIAHSIHTRIPVTRTYHGTPKYYVVRPADLLMHGDVVWLEDGIGLLDDAGWIRFNQLFDEQPSKTEFAHPSNPKIQTVSDEYTSDRQSHGIDSRDANQPQTTAVTETSQSSKSPAPAELIIPALTDGPIQIGVSSLPEKHRAKPPIDAAVSPAWDTVLISGLLASITLILTGWLKIYHQTTAPAAAAALASSDSNKLRTNTSRFEVTTLSDSGPGILPPASEDVATKNSVTDLSAQSETLFDSAITDSVVTEQEWLSDRYLDTSVKNSGPTVPVDLSKPEPTAEADFQSALVVSQSHSASDDTHPPLTTTDGLEDLLHNRIRVKPEQANLPIRVTLYGRPAGPQRLRIDSAHTQISSPKFMASNQFCPDVPQNVTELTDLPTQDVQDTVSLDRALNSLNEQRR